MLLHFCALLEHGIVVLLILQSGGNRLLHVVSKSVQ